MAKNARKIVEDLFKSELAHAESLPNGQAKYEALNRVQRNIDNGVRQVVDFLNAKGGQDWQSASDDEIREAVFNKRYKPNEFSVMLQDKENEERNKSIMQSDAMKVTGTTPYVNDRGLVPIPIKGETSNFAWQDMDPTQIKLAMAKAGYHNPDDPKQREDFMRRLSEASIAANRGEILNDWNGSGYNIAMAPWNTLNDEGKKQIATGKGDKDDLALAGVVDLGSNIASVSAPKFIGNSPLNVLWQMGAEAGRQVGEGVLDVGDEEANLDNVTSTGLAAATVPAGAVGIDAILGKAGRAGGELHALKEGIGQSMIGNPKEEALALLKGRLTRNGATTDYAGVAAKNPELKVWNNNAKTVQYTAPTQAYSDDMIHYPTVKGQELPESLKGLDKDAELTKGTSWQVRQPELVYHNLDANNLTPDAVYWRDMARSRLAEAQKAGDKEAEAYFSKVVKAFETEGKVDPKTGYYVQAKKKSKENIETIEKFVDDVAGGKVNLDTEFTPTSTLSSNAETKAEDTLKRNAQTQRVTNSLKGTDNVFESNNPLNPEDAGLKKWNNAGRKFGYGAQFLGGKIEPVILEGRNPLENLTKPDDYKLQPWYQKMSPDQKEAFDTAYEKHLTSWNK